MNPLLVRARTLAASGAQTAASKLYQQALETEPGALEALMFLARLALAAEQPLQAVHWLLQAVRFHPAQAHVQRSLGIALAEAGQLDAAEASLRAALALDPQMAAAQLHLGGVLQRLGRHDESVRTLYAAIRKAQARGDWMNAATTPPWLSERVLEAMERVAAWRSGLLQEILAPHRERHGNAALTRIDRALAGYLKPGSERPSDPAQRPRFLYVPGLDTRPMHRADRIAFADALTAAFPAIRAEAVAQWESATGFQPFLEFGANNQVEHYLGGEQPAWDALFFFRHGQRYPHHLAGCPHTAQVLESAPLIQIPGHAPEICFSVLKPGTHILPHTGVSNLRLVVHLPLVIPSDCALRVAGEDLHWREGELLVFDDTFEHEAWNRSEQTRIILLLDAWHPDLDEAERAALTDLIHGIGVINRGAA